MDRQEAIKGLKNLFSEHELSLPNTDSLEILNMAIAALEKEDAEEQGLIVRLPCKVGDILWCIDNKKVESFVVKEFLICAYKIDRIEVYFENATGFTSCLFDGTLDEGWYFTREEAEQALERGNE